MGLILMMVLAVFAASSVGFGDEARAQKKEDHKDHKKDKRQGEENEEEGPQGPQTRLRGVVHRGGSPAPRLAERVPSAMLVLGTFLLREATSWIRLRATRLARA